MNSETGHFEQIYNAVDQENSVIGLLEHRAPMLPKLLRHRSVAAIACVAALAGLGKEAAASPATESAQQSAGLSQVGFDQFTHTDPNEVLQSLSQELFPKQGMVIETIKASADEVRVAGDCENGSSYKLWFETPTNIYRETCDGDKVTTAYRADGENTSSTFQQILNTVGSELVNDVPGQSVDFKQRVTSLTGSAYSIAAEMKCPRPKSKKAALSVHSIEAKSTHESKIDFCDSKKSTTILSTPKTDSKAFKKYLSDPIRKKEWGGDYQRTNLFISCPTTPEGQTPNEKLKYNQRTDKLAVKYDLSNYADYCDPAGKFTAELQPMFRKNDSARFKKMGKSAIHVSGLQEILVFGGYELPYRYSRHKTVFPKLDDLCSNKDSQVRLDVTYRFIPKKTQTWVHGFDGSTDMNAGVDRYKGEPKNIC